MQNSAAPPKQKTVNFRDMFSMQYLPETNSEVHEQSVALNANAQREAALNANAQREAALSANALREAALNANRHQETALNAEARPYRPQQAPAQMYATWQPQANLPGWREPWVRGNQPSISQSRYSAGTSTLQHSRNVDIGWTIRQWKLQFSGAESSNIEEFIERVSECRALVPYITDEDLLNAMTELTSGVAHHWCRQECQKWQSWQDFCEDARRCYGVDKRFQRRLRKEAESRTQGRDEPVRDYIVCLRAILSKFDRPWTEAARAPLR